SQLVYKLKKMECIGNPERVKNISCHVKPINWNLGVGNMDCFLTYPLINPYGRLQVFQRDYSNQFKPFLIDVTINICEVIEKRNFIPYGVIVWKMLRRFTNANHSCPFVGQMTCRDGYLEPQLIPPFPKALYLIHITIMDKNATLSEYVGTVKFYLQTMDMIKIKKKPSS
ncbi:hypothetical protein KR009_005396, partial [Drosophila setifemur]